MQRLVDTNGMQLRVTEAGERGDPAVVLAHGFPSLGYSWRRIIPALAEAGYHVLAPDQRGFGGSSRPEAVDAYDIAALTADLVGLLDDAGAQRAVWVGQDLGGMVVWAAAHLHRERVAGVVGSNFRRCPAGSCRRPRRTGRWSAAASCTCSIFSSPASLMLNSTRIPPGHCAG